MRDGNRLSYITYSTVLLKLARQDSIYLNTDWCQYFGTSAAIHMGYLNTM